MRLSVCLVLVGLVFGLGMTANTAQADLIDATIHDIRDTSSALWDTLDTNADTLRTTGIITGADQNATGFGFYIQMKDSDPPALALNFRGILVFTGGNNQFADSGYALGDEVEVMGAYTEFQGGAELISPTGITFGPPLPVDVLSTGNPLPGPTLVTPDLISFNGLVSEQYETMFCRLNGNVKVASSGVTDPRIGNNWFLAVTETGPQLDSVLVNMSALPPAPIIAPDNGTIISFLQGIVDERSLGHQLNVRDGLDILLPTPPNVVTAHAIDDNTIRVQFDRPMDQTSSEDVNNYTRTGGLPIDSATLQPDEQSVYLVTTTFPQSSPNLENIEVSSAIESKAGAQMGTNQNRTFVGGLTTILAMQTPESGKEYNQAQGSDTTQFLNQVVTVRGTVVARFGSLIWIQDPAGGLRSGFQLFAPSGPMAVGDDVTVVGNPIEFFDQTEISGTIFEVNHGPGVMPAPLLVANNDFETFNQVLGPAPAREDYEAILVQVNDVRVFRGPDGANSNEVTVYDINQTPTDIDTVRIDNRGSVTPGWGSINPTLGDNFASIVGAFEVVNNGGYWRARIQPRDSTDFTLAATNANIGNGARLALSVPAPNPVSFSANGSARLSFTLPKAGAVSMKLYDIRGAVVRTLAGGQSFEAGAHSLRWDGTNNAGSRVSPGIYFVQLRLENQIATSRLVVAE